MSYTAAAQTGLRMLGNYWKGKAQQEDAHNQAVILEEQGRFQAEQIEYDMRMQMGFAEAKAGAMGAKGTGSVAAMVEQEEVNMQRDIFQAKENARLGAAAARARGDSARSSTLLGKGEELFGDLSDSIGDIF